MCGLICASSGSKNGGKLLNEIVEKSFEKQKARGVNGFGFIAIKGKKFSVERSTTQEEILEKLKQYNDAEHILFHHRAPTSIPNYVEATHPFLVSHTELKYDYLLMQNGSIHNETFLYKEYKELGYKFNTLCVEVNSVKFLESKSVYIKEVKDGKINDSEASAIDFARTYEGLQGRMKSSGGSALMVLKLDKKSKTPLSILYGHNGGRPLMSETIAGTDTLLIRSENGDVALDINKLYEIVLDKNDNTQRVTVSDFEVGIYFGIETNKQLPAKAGYTGYNTARTSYNKHRHVATIEEAIEVLTGVNTKMFDKDDTKDKKTSTKDELDKKLEDMFIFPDKVQDSETESLHALKHRSTLSFSCTGFNEDNINVLVKCLRNSAMYKEAAQIRKLHEDLITDIDNENSIITELNSALTILQSFKQDKDASKEDVEAALYLVKESHDMLELATRGRVATQAELEASINDLAAYVM